MARGSAREWLIGVLVIRTVRALFGGFDRLIVELGRCGTGARDDHIGHRCKSSEENDRLLDDPAVHPAASIFGFARAGSAAARAFYDAMGFSLSNVQGVCREGSAVVFRHRYEHCRLFC
jgi:hypothetical protein